MSLNQTDLSGVYAMLEEIKTKVERLPTQSASATTVTPEIRIANLPELEDTISRLEEAAVKASKPQIQLHKIDLTTNFGIIGMILIMVAIVVLTWFHVKQRNTIDELEDNDLKYRYIEMRGSAKAEDVLMLREVFDFNRNADSIKIIRKRVERYERLIQEQAEKAARATLTAEEAENLRREAEKIRTGRD